LDGEDEFRTSDPELLNDPSIPRKIRSLMMTLHVRTETLTIDCSIDLDCDYCASLSVSADDPVLAHGVFEDIQRDLQERRYSGSWLTLAPKRSVSRSFLFWMAVSLTSTFGITLVLIHLGAPARAAVMVAWPFAVALAWLTTSLAERAFPPVRFSGRFFDPSRIYRNALYGALSIVLSSILIPIAVEILKSMVAAR